MKLTIPEKLPKLQIATFLILVVLVASSTYFYIQYKNEQASNPTRELKETVTAVSKLIELPQDEEPSLATVTQKEKLSEQEFFTHAENGDKVLIYPTASKAILFRPSTNKIINVSSINTNPGQTGEVTQSPDEIKIQEPLPTPPPLNKTTPEKKELTITLLNGTKTTGITKVVENTITSELKEFTVVNRETAQKTNYEETIVVDITGENTTQIESLAKLINAKTASLPKGEILPESDILIIVGGDLTTEQ